MQVGYLICSKVFNIFGAANMSKCILGIDVGTTNVKSVLFALDGSILIQERFEYPTFFPETGWAEQDAEQWWEATVETISQITTNPQINKYKLLLLELVRKPLQCCP